MTLNELNAVIPDEFSEAGTHVVIANAQRRAMDHDVRCF